MVQRGALCPILAAFLVLGAAGPGCGKKQALSGPPPELTGLAVIPASVEVVVGADIAKLTDSPVIDRAVEQVVMRDAALSERWQRLKDECKIDLGTQIKRVMFIYHYLPALGFALLALGLLLDRSGRHARRIGAVLLVLAAAAFVWFAPISYGLPITHPQFDARMWIDTWR